MINLGHNLYCHNTSGMILVYGPKSLPGDLEKIDGLALLIDPETKDNFTEWLKSTEVADIAAKLSVPRSWGGRARKAFGISGYYSGQSRTTAWRHRDD